MKHLLKISDLNQEDFELLLRLAQDFKSSPHSHISELQGDTVILYFTHPSTRTRISFQSAISHLGGTAILLGTQDLQLARGETIEDTARVFSQYSRAVVIRTADHTSIQKFATNSRIPVINALSNDHHPCQALADMFTLKEHFGTLKGTKLAYIGDGNNVAHSLIEAVALNGVQLNIACPVGYEPSPKILKEANSVAIKNRCSITLFHSPKEAIQNVDAIYTDTWLSMGHGEEEKSKRLKSFSNFQITEELMRLAKPEAVFMHCLPAHRGEEVVTGVIDSSYSIVFKQSENRLYTGQAVLYALLNNLLVGKI